MPTDSDTTTKKYLCDHRGWPLTALGERHKPIGILCSDAAKHKHLGEDASIAEHIQMAIVVNLFSVGAQLQEQGAPAGWIAAVELALFVVNQMEAIELTPAQQAWERHEKREVAR